MSIDPMQHPNDLSIHHAIEAAMPDEQPLSAEELAARITAEIDEAYAEVQSLQDVMVPPTPTPRELARGNQLHRSACVGKPLIVHVDESRDHRLLNPGETATTSVRLRIEGQFIDRGPRMEFASKHDARAWAIGTRRMLAERPVPIPA